MPAKRVVHLVCNAHIDPVWLWEWEEGAAAAISTFRTAADLCEEFDDFIFCHNEALLYRWVEEYEPVLFIRIQNLVKLGKWHIMGGWYLQPDCNMPSGESFIRQILLGRRYFSEKFNAVPTTAINFDPFGHTRGLVQILAKSGFDSYLFCRPDQAWCPLENDEFIWEGYDGSRVLASRPYGYYNSALGKARQKVEEFLKEGPKTPSAVLLWGVGDHGGGPSHQDLLDLGELIRTREDITLIHSTPEAYFSSLIARSESLPVWKKDLNPYDVGCYTSMARVKQKHRLLENELFSTEKMATQSWARGWLAYPQQELEEVMRDLATSEFHDILPGSSIQPAEEMALRILDHGLEILSRVKARAFFSLAQGQPPMKEGEIPILVYNPHPYSVRRIIECEFQLIDQNWPDCFTDVTVYQGDQALPTQVEKEVSNLALDWRKRVAFQTELSPSQMNRFDCRLNLLPRKPSPSLVEKGGIFHFTTDDLDVVINAETGLLDRYQVHGVDYLASNAFCGLVMLDDPDPWGMRVRKFRNLMGQFTLLSRQESNQFSGAINPSLPAVRVIEDGAVRAIVEAVFGYHNSFICQRYKLPKHGTEIEVETRVHWNEKDRMLKLSLPVPDKASQYLGQVAYGVDSLPGNGDEVVAHKWVAVHSKTTETILTVINDGVYGSDFCYGELRLSLLRSPAYSGHPIGDRPILPDDRYSPRIDQGERLFHFWINGGPADRRLSGIDREALVHNEKPMALSFFPAGGERSAEAFITLSDEAIQLTALKKSEKGDDLIVRLFNPTGQERKTQFVLPSIGFDQAMSINAYEIKTLRIDIKNKTWDLVNLIEQMEHL